MTASYIAYHPEQQQLLPSALQDWLPQDHLAYFVKDTIDSLDLSAVHVL
jgi:transposase